MDELDFLKKDWNKQDQNYPKLSYDEIYKMIWKRSSSIVKWIFIISLIELLVGTVLNLVLSGDDYWETLEQYNLKEVVATSYVVSYLITFYFIFRFYRNYKKISATDDAFTLMRNILTTRKTVKYYIAYILISTAITIIGISVYMIFLHAENHTGNVQKYVFDVWDWAKFIGISILVIGAFLGLIWLFYRIIYGILLKRLKRNYNELKKLEM